ncbi:MAG TPA: Ig-like domain-containing protein [Fibrobacteraceae bacterium]|nr:Ig-like domain-containing protein [Fibrobacteraceae bacterium]
MKTLMLILLACSVYGFGAVPVTEVATLPTSTALGSGDSVNCKLIGDTYSGGNGPGIWIVADGGYRLYLNGQMLAQDNQAGRVTFVPMTFLPGTNTITVIGADNDGSRGVLVQIDELDSTHVSNATWKASASVTSNTWKQSSFSDDSWSAATVGNSATTMPNGSTLSGFASSTNAKWIWSSGSSDSVAVLRYTFTIAPIGFGASTTGGASGDTVISSDMATIISYLTSSDAKTILIPEGIYDFRNTRTAVGSGNYGWCTRQCSSSDLNSSNIYFRVTFDSTCSSDESLATSLNRWDRLIYVKANKTLIGMGRGAALRGASMYLSGSTSGNDIFRNLSVYDVNPHMIEAGDGISSDNTSNLWIDHCSFKWISDGNDLGGDSAKGHSVTWSVYDGENDTNCYKYDPYVALVENAELTYAYDYWKNTSGRVPKVVSDSRASKVHILNNYFNFNNYYLLAAHGTSTYTTQVLWESNYFYNAKSYLCLQQNYGYIWSKNNTFAGTVGKFYYEDVDGTGSYTQISEPKDSTSVFTPSYSYTVNTVSDLPTLISNKAGMGAEWADMPSDRDTAAGLSNQAPTVSLTSPTDGATSTGAFTLTATASDSDGSVSSVAFYIGTTLVGTATSSPYSVSVSGLSSGTYSVIAVATDNDGLTGTSDFVTVTVNSTDPTITYVDGDTNQIVLLGDSIEAISYTYINSASAAAAGLPDGVSATLNTSDSTLVLSGAPTTAGTYAFSVYTVGGIGTADSLTGTFLVVAKATTVSAPASILSLVNAAYPHEGEGAYEEKNDGWIDSGYYNFTNSDSSYGLWRLKASSAQDGATLVIRFANGGTEARHMSLTWNDTVLGAVPFASTSVWTTWDSVSLSADLVQGLNTLQLNSIGSEGGPNVDEFEFDVAGVTLWNDSTDTVPTQVSSPGKGLGAASYDPVRGVLFAPMTAFAQITLYDLQGKQAAYQARNVPAGESSLSVVPSSLSKGIYWVETRLDGKLVAAGKMVKLQ